MKKISYLWLLGLLSVMILGFTACSDDDDKEPGSSAELVGTWKFVNGYYIEKENGKIIREENDGGSDDERLVFKADGYCGSYIRGHLSDAGTWTYKGGNIYVTFNDEGDVYTESLKVLELTTATLTVEYADKEKVGETTFEYYSKETYRKVQD